MRFFYMGDNIKFFEKQLTTIFANVTVLWVILFDVIEQVLGDVEFLIAKHSALKLARIG